jgi:DNA (cytosine-5)-methyltransferase 1
MTNRKFIAVELYAGIARTWEPFRSWKKCDLGLLIDIDQYAAETYKRNHPSAPYLTQDLRQFSGWKLKDLAGGAVDILLGCPPCQGFSDTGKRDPRDPRNGHIGVFGRFVAELKPLVVVMENVPLLATSPRYSDFTALLERHGYNWNAAIVNAALYGSCQTRQRLLLVAAHKSLKATPRFQEPTHAGENLYFNYGASSFMKLSTDPVSLLGATPATGRAASKVPVLWSLAGNSPIPYLSEVLGGLPRLGSWEAERLSHCPWAHGSSMRARMSRVPEGGRWRGGAGHFSQSYGRLHRRGLARTITSYFSNPGSGRFWHPYDERTLTLREAARVQGIEDRFLFNGPPSKAAKLVGNALDLAIANVGCAAVRQLLG